MLAKREDIYTLDEDLPKKVKRRLVSISEPDHMLNPYKVKKPSGTALLTCFLSFLDF